MNKFNKQITLGAGVTGGSNGYYTGAVCAGTAVATHDLVDNTLSALVAVVIGTGSFTYTPKWQVSQNNSTWRTVRNELNTAATAFSATDAVVLDAPRAVNGWPYARFVLVTGGASGGTPEQYDIRYTYRRQ